MKLVYLAGPITGLSYGTATDWRAEVAAMLSPDLEAVSPMRNKSHLAGEDEIRDSYEHTALSSAKGITVRDRNDVARCDALLVNVLGAERVSIGTVMEIAWADAWRKPVVLVAEAGNVHRHPMVTESVGFVVDDLSAGVRVVQYVLGTGV